MGLFIVIVLVYLGIQEMASRAKAVVASTAPVTRETLGEVAGKAAGAVGKQIAGHVLNAAIKHVRK